QMLAELRARSTEDPGVALDSFLARLEAEPEDEEAVDGLIALAQSEDSTLARRALRTLDPWLVAHDRLDELFDIYAHLVGISLSAQDRVVLLDRYAQLLRQSER